MNRAIQYVILVSLMMVFLDMVCLVPVPYAQHEVPLTLKECLKKAVKDNQLLAEAELSVQAGEKSIDSAVGKHFPKLGLDANYTKRQDPWPYIPAQSATILPRFSDEFSSWTVIMTLPLYQGGQVSNGVELAKVRKSAQTSNLSLTRSEIIANVSNTYNKILQLQKLREAILSSVSALESQLKYSQLGYQVGRIAKVDVLKVEVQVANEKQRLIFLDEGLANSTATLRYLMGEKVTRTSAMVLLADKLTTPALQVDFETALKTAQKNRPEYLLAETGVQEAELNRKIAIGKLLPSLGAFAGYMDQYGYNPYYKEANWFAGINIFMPIFEMSTYNEIAKERILKTKAEKRISTVENQIRLDIQTAISSLAESKNRIFTTRLATEQAEESFRIERIKYESGAGTVVDLLFAQSAYTMAVSNHNQALFDYNAAIVAYKKATGTLEELLQ